MEKFTKVKNIGKGNMGACALARNNEDGRYYVIKQVDLAKLSKKERQQSLNEAKVLSSLRHPNVINYIDSFLARKSDHLCIVMEFADGGDLSAKVKHSHGVPFPQDQVTDWFIQIALALHHIHSRKILHRDVKTQNIFLTQEGVCKLGDFGIARTLNSTFDQASTFVGTPYYLSPELILERPYDCMSDVWALGVVFYELLALKHPFNANDMKALMHKILKVQYEAPPHIYSNELRSIVGRMLVKDPMQRIRLAEVLELPIVVRRMTQWLQGGIVPGRYLASLFRHKLLPPTIMQAAPLQQLPMLPSISAARSSQEMVTEDMRHSTDDYIAKQLRREELRHDFKDLKLKPKPSNLAAPPPLHYAQDRAPLPMPARDPGLLHHYGIAAVQPIDRQLPAVAAPGMGRQHYGGYNPRAAAQEIPGIAEDAAGRGYRYQAMQPLAPVQVPARVQPSAVRGLFPMPPRPQNVAAANANLQAMLQQAAQQRMLARQPQLHALQPHQRF